MISCCRRLTFCAGHRIMGHENKCANIHGHNYVVEVHARASKLDDLDRVIDFSCIKEAVGSWLEKHWDHGFIYHHKDEEVRRWLFDNNMKKFAMTANPTAEHMAHFLLTRVCPAALRDYDVHVFRITLWETENCKAEAWQDGVNSWVNRLASNSGTLPYGDGNGLE